MGRLYIKVQNIFNGSLLHVLALSISVLGPRKGVFRSKKDPRSIEPFESGQHTGKVKTTILDQLCVEPVKNNSRP